MQVKMQELGVATHPAYQIVCYLDHKAMVTVHTEKYGMFSPQGLVSYSFVDLQIVDCGLDLFPQSHARHVF
jgi:hypothetical protein